MFRSLREKRKNALRVTTYDQREGKGRPSGRGREGKRGEGRGRGIGEWTQCHRFRVFSYHGFRV
jgi:hypothetical protein